MIIQLWTAAGAVQSGESGLELGDLPEMPFLRPLLHRARVLRDVCDCRVVHDA